MAAAGRTLSDPRLSPDGTTVALVASGAGGSALVLVPADGGPEVVLSADPRPARGPGSLDWLPDGSGLVHVGADGGLWVQPAGGGAPTALPRTGGAAAPAVDPHGTRVAYVVDGRHVAVAPLDPSAGWPERWSAAPDFAADPAWSPGGELAWHEWDVPAMAWDDSRVVVAAGPGGPAEVPTPHPGAVAQPRWSPDGRLGLLCDGAGWLVAWATAAGEPTGAPAPLVDDDAEHGGPTWGPGARTWTWCGPDLVALTRNVGGFGELCLLRPGGPIEVVDRGVFSGLSHAAGRLAALRSGARTPDQVVVYDLRAPDVRRSRRSVARGPVAGVEAGAVEPELVHWEGAEVGGVGREVHGRLSRSPAATGAPGPLLVRVHGGPTGQHQVTWNARSAFLLARGWSVLEVDPRGSTGWGRAYAQALTGRWGRLDVDDVVAGIRAAGERGWGDPARTAIMGGSSAGLVALSVLAHHPGLCAAGIDLYGVVDLFELDETTHRFEAHYNPRLLGALPAAAAEWRDRSPITHAAAIEDPLLVLYGGADQVVVPAQSERLVALLEARGAVVEHHRYEGEGHGWSRPETVADELVRIDAFLTRHVLRRRP